MNPTPESNSWRERPARAAEPTPWRERPARAADSPASILASLQLRQRRLNILRSAAHGLFAGAVAACALAIAFALAGVLSSAGASPIAFLLLPALTAALGAAIGALLPLNPLRLARALDAAAAADDRFASALQLTDHPQQARARLIMDDALARIRGTPAAAALPLHFPRTARWIPIPLIVLAALMLLAPQPHLQASDQPAPEISADQWQSIHDEFLQELAKLPDPRDSQEEELRRELQQLAELLKQNPDKKEALKEIARLSDRLERQRGTRNTSMKSAARAIANSQSLKKFASKLRQGDYDQAASELRKLSQDLKEGKQTPDASEFEAISADLQRMAAELAENEEMQGECENSASAASSMNRDALAEALRRLAEQMEKNAQDMRQCDNAGQCRSLLDMLKRRLNQSQCQGCNEGCSSCEGGSRPGNRAGKGGLKAGWGTAANWKGGDLKNTDEKRTPELSDAMERQGASTSFKIVSPDERAQSGKKYEELYAEFVQKAEADLDLDSVPTQYRDYLRRYFNSIRPPAAEDSGEEK
jgi:hypothetical protein